MDTRDAVALLGGAVPRGPAVWADLGAGAGTFTRALAELLGPEARIYAVDRDPRAVAALERWAAKHTPTVVAVAADFIRPGARAKKDVGGQIHIGRAGVEGLGPFVIIGMG